MSEVGGVAPVSPARCFARSAWRSSAKAGTRAAGSAARAHARSESQAKPSPGGSWTPFCEPLTTASSPQACGRSSAAARLVTASTSTSASGAAARTAAAIAATSCRTPVDVSECTTVTASGAGPARTASTTARGSCARPHGTSSSRTANPKRRASSAQRSPNLPPVSANTVPPRGTAASSAPSKALVPDPADEQDVVARDLRELGQRGAHPQEGRAEGGRAVVDDGPRHGGEHVGADRHGAGGEQALLGCGHGASWRVRRSARRAASG